MLNNLTILSVVVALFVYFGGKNVPKELSKYKLLIVGFTCGLIICSFVKRDVETFTVGNYNEAPGSAGAGSMTGRCPPSTWRGTCAWAAGVPLARA